MARCVLGGILIGGASRRMGQPKQLCCLAGVTFYERVAAALRPHTQQVVAIGAGPLPGSDPDPVRLDDVTGVAGPLAGILAALRWRPEATWLIAACDLPFVTPAAIGWLLEQGKPEAAAVIPRLDARGVEALLAVYAPSIRAAAEALAVSDLPAPRRLVGLPGVRCPQVPPHLVGCWRNVNQPDDLDGCRG